MPINPEIRADLLLSRDWDLSNHALGELNWRTQSPQLIIDMEQLRSMLLEAVDICQNPAVPDALVQTIEAVARDFLSWARELTNFRLDPNQNNQPRINSLRDQVGRFLGMCFHPEDYPNERNRAISFLTTYGAVQSYTRDRARIELEDIQETLLSAREELSRLSSARSAVTAEAGRIATQIFSRFYRDEARSNSRVFTSGFPWVGAAQIWLLFGLISLIALISTVHFFPVHLLEEAYVRPIPNQTRKQVKTDTSANQSHLHLDSTAHSFGDSNSLRLNPKELSLLIEKILLISILIFLVRFSFKQFNIRKHISTVNLHRANLADTMSLFLGSTLVEEKEIRQAIVMEVIKGVATPDQTGYIEDKGSEINFPIVGEPLKAAKSSG